MRALGRWLCIVVALLSAGGCVTTRDYGSGACTEYKPLMCLEGNMVCERDARGCEVCSCKEGLSTPARMPPQ